MEIYDPPIRPQDVYTEGFWHGVAAAVFYTIGSMLLMVNMLGFFLGQYPENFALSDSQRTLILQTMAFFIWLGGGAAIFSKIEHDNDQQGWDFVDAVSPVLQSFNPSRLDCCLILATFETFPTKLIVTSSISAT